MTSTPPDVAPEEQHTSPKHLAFVIDFGESKSHATERHKALVEKLQNRHKRGQSLSKLDELPPPSTSTSKRQPSSVCLPRKNSFQSEGYFSCDERGDHPKPSSSVNKNPMYSRLRADLRLPLKNVNSDKMTQSFPNGGSMLSSINSPELELQDVSSPELDLVSPFSPIVNKHSSGMVEQKLVISSSETQTWEETVEESDINSCKFVDAAEFDFDKSDTPSETGTYTLDTDNYTEEQKARMSIDRDFNIEQISGKQKTEEYLKSLQITEDQKKPVKMNVCKPPRVDQFKGRPNSSKNIKESDPSHIPSELGKNCQEQKLKGVSPILSPTQNLSITGNLNGNENKNLSVKLKDEARFTDKGCVTSVTATGIFGFRDKPSNRSQSTTSLTKTRTETVMYLDREYKSNDILQSGESLEFNEHSKCGNLNKTDLVVNRLSTYPPTVHSSGKSSPSKIPSPIHSASGSPRTRYAVVVDSDSSVETESYLKPTQTYINSLQKRLSLDGKHEGDFHKGNIRLNNDLQKMAHIRHNSYDDKNLKVSNKLEHFHNKSLQGIDQTYINKFNQFTNPVHKIHNSPNNSPVLRSNSFSSNKIQNSNVQRKVTNLTAASGTKPNNLRNSPMLDQTYSQTRMKPYLAPASNSSSDVEHSKGPSQFGDTESSSEDDYDKHILRKKDLSNLSTTRYNRAFALRRARLEETPAPPPKCPNTPEMRRKFPTVDRVHSERAVSVDRRPIKTSSVPSRYMQSSAKTKPVERCETPKNVPKYSNERGLAISRTDSGRISVRSSKPNLPPKQKSNVKDIGGKAHSGGRSNSTLTSKEVEFQNWKRRKSYDPMKSAAEGRKKMELAKKQYQNPMTQSYNENQQCPDCDSSPSHSSSVHRSQSFHGTAALAHQISSEEDDELTLSADEGFSPPAPSPYTLSPARVITRQAWRNKLLN